MQLTRLDHVNLRTSHLSEMIKRVWMGSKLN